MVSKVEMAFHPEAFMLRLEQILPLRSISPNQRHLEKYKCIMASMKEVGLIEPLIVHPQKDNPKMFLLLDGVVRLDILKALGETEALCLKATEDEALTYNHKVNQLSPIQEHFMILKALSNGVSEERIAVTLNVDVGAIRRKRDLLCGICPEAVTLLKDKRITASALREIKRVVPLRQIEMAELLIAANNFTTSYAKCLYTATPDEQRIVSDQPAEDRGISAEDTARMRHEMATLHRDIKLIEETHGENVLHLVPAVGYLRKLLANTRVERFMRQRYGEFLTEFQKIIDSPDLDSGKIDHA